MNYQKAIPADIDGILVLQNKNLIQNLSLDEKKDGFLSVAFTHEQFVKMNDEAGIIVCKENESIRGYLCTSTTKFNKAIALPSTIINMYSDVYFKEKSLDQYHSIVAGPWCIARECRGKNIFVNMWNALPDILAPEVELIVTFISIDNLRSLSAAKKVGMEEVSTFTFDGHEFCLLVTNSNLMI